MKSRGDVELTLGGRDVVLRPTFEAIESIEDKTGRGLFDLIQEVAARQFGVREVATIIWASLVVEPGGKRPSRSEIGNDVMGEGLINFMGPVGTLLTNALTGGKEIAEGKEETETEEASE